MTAVAITTPGAFIPAAVCAAIRHPLQRDLAAARRDRITVDPEIVAAVELIDNVGAWFENKRVSDVSSDVALLEPQSFAAVDWDSMTVPAAAAELHISPQATRRLCERGTLHGERGARAWRVCADSVTARKEGTRCQH